MVNDVGCPAGVDAEDRPGGGGGPRHEHQDPVHQARPEQEPARSPPAPRGQMSLGEQPQTTRDQDQAERPGGLERDGEPAERQRAMTEPVIQDRVRDRADLHRDKHPDADHEPAEQVAWPTDRYQHPDRHRRQQGHQLQERGHRSAGQRDKHQAGDVERDGKHAKRERRARGG